MIFGMKERRRRRLRAQPFPQDWRKSIERDVPFFHRLSAADQAELIGHIQVFLAEKRFEGCGGLKITDTIRLSVAAQACLLLLRRKTDYFPRLLTILVYPTTYVAEEERRIEGPIWEEGTSLRQGETGRTLGAMVLTWDAVKSGAADSSDGKNLVLHEFAHQLDYENDAADGAPALLTRSQQLSWREVMRIEFASLRAADDTGIPDLARYLRSHESSGVFCRIDRSVFRTALGVTHSSPEIVCRNCSSISARTQSNIPKSE